MGSVVLGETMLAASFSTPDKAVRFTVFIGRFSLLAG
jgi:hypothetical protein